MAKKFRSQPSAGRITLTLFWDMEGAILVDFTPKRETIKSYIHMFGPMTEAPRGRRFSSNEVIGLVQNWLKTQPKNFSDGK
jgi:hypothetical protein